MMAAFLFTFVFLALSVHAGNIGFSLGIGFTPSKVQEAAPIVFMDGAGDSLSVAYNAVTNGLPNTNSGDGTCSNGAMAGRLWGSELASTVCPVQNSPARVKSFAERVFCSGSNVLGADPKNVQNHAVSGADMLNNMKTQADQIATALRTAPSGRRQVDIFMGHNDLCSGTGAKTSSNSCGGNTDKDSSSYCFTRSGAFEREFRNGLDSLIQAPNTTISVLAPARVSQLCLVKNLQMCQPVLAFPRAATCGNAWIGLAGICLPLTQDCSDTRVVDTYNYELSYVNALKSAITAYNNVPVGGNSPIYTFNGKTVGGKPKAAGVNIVFSLATWHSQLTPSLLSCCDCFHASVAGQQKLSDAAFSGVTCTAANPCCSDSSTPLNNGKCETGTAGVITDGSYIPGILIN